MPVLNVQIERTHLLTEPAPRKVLTLPVARIHPVIHCAHRGRLGRARSRLIVDHELIYITSGRGVYRTTDSVVPLEAGVGLLIPPFVPHVFEVERKIHHQAVHFDLAPDLLPNETPLDQREAYAVRLAEGWTWPGTWAWPARHASVDMLDRIIRDFATGDSLASAAASARLTMLLLDLLREQSDPDQPHHANLNRSRMEQAARWLERNLTSAVTAEDMAAAAGLSIRHFRRLFRDWAGMSPAEFILRARIARARHLLRNPDLLMKQIAAEVGFADQFHFSRVFRRMEGISPTSYREAVLGNSSPPPAD